ncbi:hypothetical protein [Pseudomonas guariconensis]|uniref:hypothetical protein n=1 Tax=Pseudomonas guariconensis TaxID=1288410 RepID=UPI0018AA954B|nr:hypothetical protein [Pseudomonas guariconensis]MBF8757253.1 hypothetical protein [Pseudomonas guariconensis]
MTTSKITPKNALRRRILDAAKSRGGPAGNIWYAWSEKCHASLVLPSDIALIYWLACLEFDPDVETFCLGAVENDYDFSVVRRSQGASKLIISDRRVDKSGSPSVICIPMSDVLSQSALAVKLMKPLAFAAAIAQKECVATSNAVRAFSISQKKGELHDFFDALPLLDQSEVCGVFVRHVVNGYIRMDLAEQPFGNHTRWMSRQPVTNTESDLCHVT